ncbi:hypothetical protein HOI27_04010 [bacterium]|nr:hypothetical protein [bacterium]
MKFLVTLLLTSFLFSQNFVDNIYSDSFNSLKDNLAEISLIRKQLNKKANQLLKEGEYDQANIIIKMRNTLNNNWGQLYGLLDVLSITNDILLFSAYHDCDVSLKHPNKPKFHTISNAKNKPNPNSKALLNLAIGKLNIMNEVVAELITIDLKYFTRVSSSNDEAVKNNIKQFAIDINHILNDIKENINKMVIT